MVDCKALVVGVNNYPSAPLSCCVNDAKSIASVLSTNDDGSPNFDVRLLLNEDATRANLRGHIQQLFSGKHDIALFYFSGHGCSENGNGYLVTIDYKDHDWGINFSEIVKAANNSESRNKIIIVDSCYSGLTGCSSLNDNTSELPDGITIMTACGKDGVSVETLNEGHGLFTQLMLDGLGGGSANLLGEVTPGSLYAYIDKNLGPWDQRPVFKTNVSNFISLKKTNPPIDLKILRKISEIFANGSELPLDPSYEYTNAPDNTHELVEPYADKHNVEVMKQLQALESVGLVKPVGEEHMYFAAMHSKSCALTPLGQHYLELAKKGRI